MTRRKLRQSKLDFGSPSADTTVSNTASKVESYHDDNEAVADKKQATLQFSKMFQSQEFPARSSKSGLFSQRASKHIAADSDDFESDEESLTDRRRSETRMEEKSHKLKAVVAEDSEDEDIMTPLDRRRSNIKKRVLSSPIASTSDSDPDSDSDEEPRSRKRLRQSSINSEIAAELDDLRDSSPISTPTKTKSEKRRELLEKFKQHRERRKAGETVTLNELEEEEAEYDDYYDNDIIYDNEPNDEDDDFIDNDSAEENELIGVPIELPFQFSRMASAKLEELFSHAVDWLIQNKINPGFDRDSVVYKTVWKRLNDEIEGLASSKFKSSTWKHDFIVSLEARPEISASQERSLELGDDCQACNKRGHPATYRVKFEGEIYDPDSLEAIEQIWINDIRDHKGRSVPDVREFYLGKTCYDNASNAHTLVHWKYSLNDAVLACLKDYKLLKAKKVIEREKLSVAQKKNWTKEFVEQLTADGVIKELWNVYKQFVATARESKKGNWY